MKQEEVEKTFDHLLRHNSGQMVAVLTRIFGFEKIDQIEDAIQEALLKALRNWSIKGVPDNQTAWLIQVAKNHLFDQLRRDNKSTELDEEFPLSKHYSDLADNPVYFSSEISEDQLRLIFACCHPSIPKDSQVALTLKTVGGFNNREIASAFLAKKTAIDKILVRAKKRLKEHRESFDFPPPDSLPERLDAVLKVLYLMFNEGYMASEGKQLIRKDLCFEAIRLVRFLIDHPVTESPKACALAALFLFQASRFASRSLDDGIPVILAEQDRSNWDRQKINEALSFFRRSASGVELSEFHLEAEIACQHAVAESFETTNWPMILDSYAKLYEMRPSPIVALNKAFALGKVEGAKAALSELEALENEDLKNYYPFHLTAAEFYEQSGRAEDAARSYETALALTQNTPVKKFVEMKLARLLSAESNEIS